MIVNIEIPLAPGKDLFKIYKVHHIGSPITFANTSDVQVSVITNLPAAVATSVLFITGQVSNNVCLVFCTIQYNIQGCICINLTEFCLWKYI